MVHLATTLRANGVSNKVNMVSPYNDGWTQEAYRKAYEKLLKKILKKKSVKTS